MAFITPDLIANKPPNNVNITVVSHPRPRIQSNVRFCKTYFFVKNY